MKLFSCIFIIIVLALNFVPCDDAHEMSGDHTSVIYADDHASNDHAGADLCTPFCHCSCCAASLTAKLLSSVATPVHTLITVDLHYLDLSYSNISHSIWQPPKLV